MKEELLKIEQTVAEEISKCQELSSFKPLSDLDADVIIFPILVRQNINYKLCIRTTRSVWFIYLGFFACKKADSP